jgi:hypothetical protein
VNEAARIGEEIERRHIAFDLTSCGGPPTTFEALVRLGRGEQSLAALNNLPAATP